MCKNSLIEIATVASKAGVDHITPITLILSTILMNLEEMPLDIIKYYRKIAILHDVVGWTTAFLIFYAFFMLPKCGRMSQGW